MSKFLNKFKRHSVHNDQTSDKGDGGQNKNEHVEERRDVTQGDFEVCLYQVFTTSTVSFRF